MRYYVSQELGRPFKWLKIRHFGFVSSPRETSFALSVFETGRFLHHVSGPNRKHLKPWKLSYFNLFRSEAVLGKTEIVFQEMSCNAEHALTAVEFVGSLITKIQAISTAYNETEEHLQQGVILKFLLERLLHVISRPSLTINVC